MGQIIGKATTAEINANFLPRDFLWYIVIAVAQKSNARIRTVPKTRTTTGICSLCLKF